MNEPQRRGRVQNRPQLDLNPKNKSEEVRIEESSSTIKKDTPLTSKKNKYQEAQVKMSKQTKKELATLRDMYGLKYDYEIIDYLIDTHTDRIMTPVDRKKFKIITE